MSNHKNPQLDKTHSSVEFAVRHMGLATVRGRFENFEVQVTTGEDGVPTAITADIDAASITTGVQGRDDHLRSADFFDAANHPSIRFESSTIRAGEDGHVVEGDLTIRGVTRPVAFTADFTGYITDPWGNARAAAEASGKIKRSDFGLTWNQVLEAGALLVSEDVKFNLAIQMVEPVEAAA